MQIRDASARAFWEAVWVEGMKQANGAEWDSVATITAVADYALGMWADRFASPDTRADLEAWQQARAGGNEPEVLEWREIPQGCTCGYDPRTSGSRLDLDCPVHARNLEVGG